jgi:methionyl-tRNA formyltransferase
MVNVVFWGTPQFAVPSLARLLNQPDIAVLGVVTQPDKRRGRGNQLIPSPVKQLAREHQLTVWQPPRVKKDLQTLDELRSLQADAFVVVAYGQILSQEILDMPRLGCINGHGSLLPHYRGAAPIQWSICNGEPETGITTMLMDVGMDTGPMLLKRSLPIELLDDAADIGRKLADITADLLVETLHRLHQGTLQPEPQDDTQATYAPLLQKVDFALDWSKSAIALHNQIRGFTPNCFAQFQGQSLKLFKTVPLSEPWITQLPSDLQAIAQSISTPSPSVPGTVIHLAKQQGLVIQTGEGPLLLQSVQLSGKKQQSGWDFVNGLRLQIGDRLSNGIVDRS